MPLFLLTNWRWLAPLVLAMVLAAGWAVTYLRLEHLQLANSQALERASEHARELEARYANTAQEIELAHQDRDNAISNAYISSLPKRVYVHAQCRNNLPQSPTDSSGVADTPVKAELSSGDGEFLKSFARDCAQDQNKALTGYTWAGSVGRK